MQRYCCASTAIAGAQYSHVPPSPWSRTSGAPEPASAPVTARPPASTRSGRKPGGRARSGNRAGCAAAGDAQEAPHERAREPHVLGIVGARPSHELGGLGAAGAHELRHGARPSARRDRHRRRCGTGRPRPPRRCGRPAAALAASARARRLRRQLAAVVVPLEDLAGGGERAEQHVVGAGLGQLDAEPAESGSRAGRAHAERLTQQLRAEADGEQREVALDAASASVVAPRPRTRAARRRRGSSCRRRRARRPRLEVGAARPRAHASARSSSRRRARAPAACPRRRSARGGCRAGAWSDGIESRASDTECADYHPCVHAERPIGMFDSGVGASRCSTSAS